MNIIPPATAVFLSMEVLEINKNISIPLAKVNYKFSRSGGKGGQHVNKVSTKVEVILNVKDLIAAPETAARIVRRLQTKLDEHGALHVTAQESRSQWQNKQQAIEKLADILREASFEQKNRKPTIPTHGSTMTRIQRKKKLSIQKTMRRRVSVEGD
jgi:ribosome-associated protein